MPSSKTKANDNHMERETPHLVDGNNNHLLSEEQIQDLLRPGKEFDMRLQSHVSQLSFGTNNLVLVGLRDYATTPQALLSYFQKEKIPGIYITINKPYEDLTKTLSNPPENVKYVDVITALTGRETEDTQHVTYLDSPLALVELNLAIADQLKALVSNKKFLILDSVSTLLVYNSPQAVEKFCHTVIAKNRNESVLGLFIMIESEEHHSVVETLAQFVDKVISIK